MSDGINVQSLGALPKAKIGLHARIVGHFSAANFSSKHGVNGASDVMNNTLNGFCPLASLPG